MNAPDCQLYLISPLDVGGNFVDRLDRALAASEGLASAFQFRVKEVDQHEAARLAAPLQEVCAAHEVGFIVNDSVPLAKRLKADGVHLGQSDGNVREAREELGREMQIGVTCHASRHLAMEAGEAGADYVAFGAFFPSTTKRITTPADTNILSWWQEMMTVPCVAIGGITASNIQEVIATGCRRVAVIGAVMSAQDPQTACLKLMQSLTQQTLS